MRCSSTGETRLTEGRLLTDSSEVVLFAVVLFVSEQAGADRLRFEGDVDSEVLVRSPESRTNKIPPNIICYQMIFAQL